MKRRFLGAFVSFSLAASSAIGGEWTPPTVATSQKQYEIAYPKKTVSAAALELERLAARFGIDTAPPAPRVVETVDGVEVERRLEPKDGRTRPDPELAERVQPTISALGKWVEQELSEPSDRIGPPPPAVERFFEDNSATLDALAAVTSGPRPIEWDLDVALGIEAPIPNLLGIVRIQRVLAARALLQMRAGDSDSALVTMDGMWALTASLAEQPFLISHIIALAQVRLVVGLLRKVDGPAYGWEERLRNPAFYDAFLAAFQNDSWPAANDPAKAPAIETVSRIYARRSRILGLSRPLLLLPPERRRRDRPGGQASGRGTGGPEASSELPRRGSADAHTDSDPRLDTDANAPYAGVEMTSFASNWWWGLTR